MLWVLQALQLPHEPEGECFPCRFEVDLVPTGSPRTYRFQLRSEEPDSLSGLAWQYTTLMGTLKRPPLLIVGKVIACKRLLGMFGKQDMHIMTHNAPMLLLRTLHVSHACRQPAPTGGSMSMWFASFYAAIPVHLSSHGMIFCRFRMSQCPSCRGRAGGLLFFSVEGFGLFRVVQGLGLFRARI